MITVLNAETNPFYNQAFEEYVYGHFPEEEIFLLWRNSPAVVVGSYQNICREVHVRALREANIPVVRRMTGGGTVYHDLGNLNYTYIYTENGEMSYARGLDRMVGALNKIGVPAQRSRVCDLAIGENKISGSAGRMVKNRVLHHGTLLFDSDLEALDRITTHRKNDAFRTKGTVSAICTVGNIRPHLKADMEIGEFQNALLDAVLPPGSARMELSDAQREQVRALENEKYRSWEWTWGKTPAFEYEKNGMYMNKPIAVSYRAKRGIVSDVRIESDALDTAKSISLLEGARLDPDGFEEICRTLAGERAEELMDWLM